MTDWWPAGAGAAPLYATRRNPKLRSEGRQVGVIASTLGTPLIPWQRYVAEVAGERREDGAYEYQVVVVTVPRQTGKTTLIRSVGSHRGLVCGRDVFYTAQTGKDARERWMDLVKVIRTHPALASRVSIGLRAGGEQVAFTGGGAFRVFAPTPESLHGYTPPTVMIDEAFSLTGPKGELLMGAIGPAQFTVQDRQLWIVSTAGTAESTFLHDWIDLAGAGTPRVALFQWGAAAHHDPYSLADISAFHPGVGFRLNGKLLTPSDVLENAEQMSRAEYLRAYANRRTLTQGNLVPSELWQSLTYTETGPPPAAGRLHLAVDVAHDRQSATIVGGWQRPDGGVRVKVVRAAPGVGWVPDALADLSRRLRPGPVLAAGNGPVVELHEPIRRAGTSLKVLTEREYAAACGRFLSLLDQGQLDHDGTDLLHDGVVGLVTRSALSGDGVAFARRASVGDTSPGVAAAIVADSVHRNGGQAMPLQVFGPAA
jgi:hypothetical protein